MHEIDVDIEQLEAARKRIAQADEQIAALFQERMDAAKDIAAYKRERGLPILDAAQEKLVLQTRSALIGDDELRPYYIQFLRDTMDVSKRWQRRLMRGVRVAYCGVEGAFAHLAVQRIFPDGTPVPYPSFEAAYHAVRTGECDLTVLPIENSYAGEVSQVVDLMFTGDLYVNGVYDLAITQNLLGTQDATMDSVKTVVSHPQALGQCHAYLRDHGFEERNATNTAVAAQTVAESGDPSIAAIASAETADLYGLKVLDHDINESKTNTTRFAVFSQVENKSAGQRDSSTFLLLFTVKDETGGLAKAINVISAYDFNLRVLRSRPMKTLPWHYYFYAEAEGDDTSENGKQMLKALSSVCPILKVVGRYNANDSLPDGDEA